MREVRIGLLSGSQMCALGVDWKSQSGEQGAGWRLAPTCVS
jgi:hypothetical protein